MTNDTGLTKFEFQSIDAGTTLRGRLVTIMGLGRHGGGAAAARYCAEQGAAVTVTDLADERVLAESVAQLVDVPIARFTFGRHHQDDFRSAEVVVVNPAVRPENSFVAAARQSGAEITSETELFLNACPAVVVGVTGTVGKSTTATMLAEMIAASGRRSWLGGNIGHSLLADLPSIRSTDIVVLELSSFQLHWLSETARWPRHAIVTNCSPNHLDWHRSCEHYVAAKQRLISHLPSNGVAVLNTSDLAVAKWQTACRGNLIHPCDVLSIPPNLIGAHYRCNASLAATMAVALEIDDTAIEGALRRFKGLPHRIQFVAEIDGRAFYDDSKSTAPAATLAALAAMNRPTWLLMGGAEKEADWTELARAVIQSTKGAAIFGSTAAKIEQCLRRTDPAFKQHRFESLAGAFAWCWQLSKPGDVILLSPACASTDQFRDFAHRGEELQRLVKNLIEPQSHSN
jgi:UDP-N-acetylmuramoylalanine--D-glutamate ligase